MEPRKTRRGLRPPARSGLVFESETPEKEKNVSSSSNHEAVQPKVTFQIGRAPGKNNTSTARGLGTKKLSNSSTSDEQELSGSSAGFSSASTVPMMESGNRSSQDDMFASPQESVSQCNTIYGSQQQSSESSINYEDFMKSSQESNSSNGKAQQISPLRDKQSSASSKTSTPRKRKPSSQLNESTNSPKLKKIIEEDTQLQLSPSEESMEVDILMERVVHVTKRSAKKTPIPTPKESNITQTPSPLKTDSQLQETQFLDQPHNKHLSSRDSLQCLYMSPALLQRQERNRVSASQEDDDDLHLELTQSQETQLPSSKPNSLTFCEEATQEVKRSSTISNKNGRARSKVNSWERGNTDDEVVLDDSPKPEFISSNAIQVPLSKSFFRNKGQNSKTKPGNERDTDQDSNGTNGFSNSKIEKHTFTGTFTFTWVSEVDSSSKAVLSRELINWKECVPEENVVAVLPGADVSPGDLADESKNNSPGSVCSTGLFALKERMSMLSKTSSDSAGSTTASNNLAFKSGTKLTTALSMVKNHKDWSTTSDENNSRSKLPTTESFEIPVEGLKGVESRGKILTSNGHFTGSLNNVVDRLTENKQVGTVSDIKHQNNNALQASTPNTATEKRTLMFESAVLLSSIDTSALVPKEPLIEKPDVKNTVPMSMEKKVSVSSVDTPKSTSVKKRGRGKGRKTSKSVQKSIGSPINEKMEEDTAASVKSALMVRRELRLPPKASEDPIQTPASPVEVAAFARWAGDKKYYSAKILGKAKDGRFHVLFYDGKMKDLSEEFVIPINFLTKGLSVYAMRDSNENLYEPGLITGYKVKCGDVLYVVKLDSGPEVSVPRTSLYMTEDQAKIVVECYTSDIASPNTGFRKRADVTTENIVYSKRVKMHSFKCEDLPSGSGVTRLSTQSDISDTPASATDDIAGVETEYFEFESHPGLTSDGHNKLAKKVKSSGHVTSTAKSDDREFINTIGPIPPEGCKIFAGMKFFLTSSNTPLTLADLSESGTNSDSSNHTSYIKTPPYVKVRLVSQLKAGGGVVYDSMENIHDYTDCYLITNGICQTRNYILCLANHVPIVSHHWVISCCKSEQKCDIKCFMLPAGYSIGKKEHVELKDRPRRLPLKNMRVLVMSESESFIGFWAKVLETVGAKVESAILDCDEHPAADGVAVVVTDHTFSAKNMNWAIHNGLTVVTSEWIKQCVINSERSNINYEGYQFNINA